MITNHMFDFTVEKVKAKYKDSDGDCNTVILQFIYCRVARDKVYVWLTSEDKVNLVEVKGNMGRYSVGLDSQEDILNYIEEYLTKDGYAEDLKIDYDYYDEEEFKRKIDVFDFLKMMRTVLNTSRCQASMSFGLMKTKNTIPIYTCSKRVRGICVLRQSL